MCTSFGALDSSKLSDHPRTSNHRQSIIDNASSAGLLSGGTGNINERKLSRHSSLDNSNGISRNNSPVSSSSYPNSLPPNDHLHLKGYQKHLQTKVDHLDSSTSSCAILGTVNASSSYNTTSRNKTNSFFLMITGHIESAHYATSTAPTDQLYCRYSFSYGPDWEVVHGVSMGLSQIARQGLILGGYENFSSHKNNATVWNFPIEISFQSTSPHGWPRLAISVYGFDFLGRDVIRGYASLLIPLTPGRHVKWVKAYRPISGSKCQQFVNWLLGTQPEYYDSKTVTRGEGRSVTRVVSDDGLMIKVVLTVTRKDFSTFGYTTTSSSQM
ncbi:hypothetical protein ACHAXS_010993 [Conticribra weissflogii]